MGTLAVREISSKLICLSREVRAKAISIKQSKRILRSNKLFWFRKSSCFDQTGRKFSNLCKSPALNANNKSTNHASPLLLSNVVKIGCANLKKKTIRKLKNYWNIIFLGLNYIFLPIRRNYKHFRLKVQPNLSKRPIQFFLCLKISFWKI